MDFADHIMSFLTCCVQDCLVRYAEGGILHRFPNPNTEQERFQTWITKIGGEVATLDHCYVFKNRRICHKHFDQIYCGSKNRLTKTAVPTLHLPVMDSDFPITQEPVTQIGSTCDVSVEINTPAIQSTSKDIFPVAVVQPRQSVMALDFPITQEPVTQIGSTCDLSVEINTPAIPSTSKDILPVTAIEPRQSGRSSMTHEEFKLKKMITNLKKEVHRNKVAKKSFKQRLHLAQKSIKHDAMKHISQKMTKAAKTFIAMQIKQAGKEAKGRRYTLEEKILALSLYKPSPKAYRLLSEICILPKKKTLNNLLQKVSLKPGINDVLFSDLKKKVKKMPQHHKYCSLIFDEMSITPSLTYDTRSDEIIGFTDYGEKKTTEFCDHALVFMVRGVIKKYKQPVAYMFCNSTMKSWDLAHQIKNIISKIQDTGLSVVATVCDQAATNMSAINILINKTKEEYIRNGKEWRGGFFKINFKKIVPLYDPPHLIKGIRNNLLTKNLKYILKGKECTAKWQHIKDLYKRSPGYNGVRLVPKLTAQHVFPELIPKMRVKICTQVFSRSVGVALGFMADAGKLTEDSKETADILLLFDNIFDSVNGSSSKIKGGKIFRTAVTPTSPHHKLWQDSIPIIKSMKYVDANGKTSTVPSITNWVKTIEGFKIIIKDFNRLGLNSILLRNFNQDPIENFFGAIRAHGCQNIMPNAAAFQGAYKTLLINNMTSTHSVGANCEKDKNSCLMTSLEHFFNNESENSVKVTENNVLEEHLFIEPINIDNLIISQSNLDRERCAALAYCSGWLLTKARKLYKNCVTCRNDLESDKVEDYHKFIKICEYSNKHWLCYPTKKAFNLFAQTENIVQIILKKCSNIKNLLEYIKLIYSINLDMSFITCYLHKDNVIKFLLHKSAIFHIFTWCKNINKILMGKELNFDPNDNMQMAAFQYREKNKTKKRLRATGREIAV